MASYQEKYWAQLKEFKVHVLYLHKYAAKLDKSSRRLDIYLALASSSSIATWAIWKEHDYLWAGIIAVSQVITAIKPLLPYEKQLKAINVLNDRIQGVSLESERRWYEVAEGQLDEREIHNLWVSQKESSMKAQNKHLKNIILHVDKSLLRAAEEEADDALTKTYG